MSIQHQLLGYPPHLGLSHHSADAPRGDGSHWPIHEAPVLGALGRGKPRTKLKPPEKWRKMDEKWQIDGT